MCIRDRGFRVTQGANGNFVSGSELDLFAEKFTSVPKGEGSGFAASKLKLKDVAISDTTDKPGKMIAFTFDAAQFGSADGTVVETVSYTHLAAISADFYIRLASCS